MVSLSILLFSTLWGIAPGSSLGIQQWKKRLYVLTETNNSIESIFNDFSHAMLIRILVEKLCLTISLYHYPAFIS